MLKVFSARIVVRKCIHDHIRDDDGDVLLFRTDHDYEQTNWAEIIDVGTGCKEFTHDDIGKFVMCPEWTNDMSFLQDNEYIIRESAITDSRFPLMVTGE